MFKNKFSTFIYFLMKFVIAFAIAITSTFALTFATEAKASDIKKSSKAKGKFKSTVSAEKKSQAKGSNSNQNSNLDKLNKSKLSTNIDFNDQTVGGKYQSPMEALSVVEDEKSIDDLIGVRKNFQDRQERAKSMR